MAKKKIWFDRLKRLFRSDAKSKYEKNEKRKRWAFARMKSKCLPALPGPSLLRSRSLGDAENEQSKHAMTVAVATAVAAEAAVAAAQAAADVVRLTGTPSPYPRAQEVAAIKIQTAFRGYLARSALKALKGLVKLQALIRGQAVRRQTTNTLKGLQSLMKIQSQACASRVRALVDWQVHDCKDITHRKTKNSEVTKTAIQQYSGRKWESSILSQEEMIALLNTRREAAIKRERAMEYASSYQDRKRPTTPVSVELDPDVEDRQWSWLDEWVGAQPLDNDIPEIFSTPCRDYISTKGKVEESQLRYLARRSFNRSRRASTKDDDSFSSSPSFPSYMASTASAKARFRSLSTPKQRLRATDSCSEYCAPITDRLPSPLPSVASNAGFTKIAMTQKSPRPKSQTGPLKCCRSSDYLSFDSECSLLNWDRHNAFR